MSNLFAVVDTARDPRLYELVHTALGPVCLFAGELAPEVRKTAPYLVPLHDAEELLNVWRKDGRGQSWGIFLRSSMETPRIRSHLRKFLMARLPDGREVLFRWWDPRVFRVYLPTCGEGDLKSWFEEVDEFMCETSDGIAAEIFKGTSGKLIRRENEMSEILRSA
jgi:hypothetical protein